MTTIDIIQRISNGEDSFTQFKQNITRAESLASEYVAFSNAKGGVIIIGVDDGGDIHGVSTKEINRLNQLISNVANENVTPPIYPLTEIHQIQEKKVLAVHIPEGLNKPYATKSGIYYTKSGADKRKVSQDELKRMFASSGNLFADEVINRNTSLADFDDKEFFRFFKNKKAKDFNATGLNLENVLNNLNLYSKGHLTLSGIMFFAFNPQQFYPVFNVQAVFIKGESQASSTFEDKKYFEGNIYKLYDQAMMFFKSSLKNKQNKQTFNTPGELEIPVSALEEAVVNALIHRDYFLQSSIKLFVFDDRVEIRSPGKLPNSLTVEKIKSGLSIARNPVIHSIAPFVLSYSGFGSGIERMVDRCGEHVDFINDEEKDEFRVIFKRPL